jgi:23S rRNA (uracil-5-)-methyltransferase RumA
MQFPMAKPQCPLFGTCGGCSAQHIDYETQVEGKKQKVKDLLKLEEVEVFTASPYYYRNRMDMMFHPKGLGFRKKKIWHSIVDVSSCPIANRPLNQFIGEIRDFFPNPDSFNLKNRTGTFKYAVIRTPGYDSSISFVLNEKSSRIAEATEQIKRFAEETRCKNIAVTYVPLRLDSSVSDDYYVVKGSDILQDSFHERILNFPVQGFFQNNREMAEAMHLYVYRMIEKYDTKDAELLDLYGGVGAFGIINAKSFKKVHIVDCVDAAIKCAKMNIKDNGLDNTEASTLDAKQIAKLTFDDNLFLITDPPRSGMNQKTKQFILEKEPKMIIYVSCNLEQMRKDLDKLYEKYELKSAAMFDFFPQTPHIETVVELTKK